jgi:hypothetical protein
MRTPKNPIGAGPNRPELRAIVGLAQLNCVSRRSLRRYSAHAGRRSYCRSSPALCGAISTNLPRIQCSSPVGERMQTSNGPPTCICTLASETVKGFRAEPALHMVGRAPGLEHRLAPGVEDAGKPEWCRLLCGRVVFRLNRLEPSSSPSLPRVVECCNTGHCGQRSVNIP